LQLSKCQRGSAVVDFVMLGAPSLIIFGLGVTFFLNSYIDTVARSIAVDVARNAALADQDQASATGYMIRKIKDNLPQVKVLADLSIREVAKVEFQYVPLPSIFNLLGNQVQIQAVAPVEVKQ
jgi:hypothetical protein